VAYGEFPVPAIVPPFKWRRDFLQTRQTFGMSLKKISLKGYAQFEGLIWVALGGVLCFGGSRLGLGTLNKPESGLMSLLTGSLLVLLGFILILSKILSKTFEELEKKGTDGIYGGKFQKVRFFSVLALILYGFLLNLLGFPVATFLLLVFLFKILSPQKWIFHIFLSLITVILTYVLFRVLLHIDFPVGIFHI